MAYLHERRSAAFDCLRMASLTNAGAVPALGMMTQGSAAAALVNGGGIRQPPSVAVFDAHTPQAPFLPSIYPCNSITSNPMRSTQEQRLVVELPSMK